MAVHDDVGGDEVLKAPRRGVEQQQIAISLGTGVVHRVDALVRQELTDDGALVEPASPPVAAPRFRSCAATGGLAGSTGAPSSVSSCRTSGSTRRAAALG